MTVLEDYNTLLTIGSTLFSGIIASIATVLLTNLKEKKKKKELIKNTRKSFVDVFTNIYLVGIEGMIEDFKRLSKDFSVNDDFGLTFNDTSFLDNDIFEILDKNILIKVFDQHHIEYHRLISLIIFIRDCSIHTPREITNNYYSNKSKQTEQFKKDLDFLTKNKDQLFLYNFEEEKNKIEGITFSNIENFKTTTLKGYSHSIDNLEILKSKILFLVDKLK